jgi:hypothetical protein
VSSYRSKEINMARRRKQDTRELGDREHGREIDLSTLVSLVRSTRGPRRTASRSAARPARPAVIAFFAAHPAETSPIDQGAECAEMMRELKLAPFRADFRIESRWATTVDELMRHLNELDPVLVHISAHGRAGALGLQDDRGNVERVSPRGLAKLIGTTARRVRVVLLNACDSMEHAQALRDTVDLTVAMDGLVSDPAARMFAARFYGALGNRRSVGNAVDQGCAKLAALGLPDEMLPRCVSRDGIDAHGVMISAGSARRRAT